MFESVSLKKSWARRSELKKKARDQKEIKRIIIQNSLNSERTTKAELTQQEALLNDNYHKWIKFPFIPPPTPSPNWHGTKIYIF